MELGLYTSWFGLTRKPFNLTSDPRYLFLSPCHIEALYCLLNGINECRPIIIITGDAGKGKTMLCRAISSYLDASIKIAFLFHPTISDTELLKIVNEKFGIGIEDSRSKSKKDYFEELKHFLLKTYRLRGKAVLIIDKAQSLSYKVLKQIRKLSNLKTKKKKLIQIVLVGQPELKDVLAAPALRLPDEHINAYCNLKPLDSKFLKGHVEHRLLVAGIKENLQFTNQAFKRIYSYSHGNPRQINAVCDLALLIAYNERKNKISRGIVENAIKKLQGDISIGLKNIDRSWNRFAPITIMLLLIFMFTGFYGFNQKEPNLKVFSLKENRIALEIDKDRSAPLGAMIPKNKITLPIQRESSKTILIEPAINKQASTKESFETKVSSKKTFTIQMGAFLSKENAVNLTEKLERRGYMPYIFEALDDVERKWYAVRMMGFNDFKDAYLVETEFKKNERKPAIVTVIDSLDPFRPEREEFGLASR